MTPAQIPSLFGILGILYTTLGGVKRSLEMILGHMAPSSLRMSPFQVICAHFGTCMNFTNVHEHVGKRAWVWQGAQTIWMQKQQKRTLIKDMPLYAWLICGRLSEVSCSPQYPRSWLWCYTPICVSCTPRLEV